MEAIEIYTKVLEILNGAKYQDANTALIFVQQKISNEYYSSEEMQKRGANLCGSALLGPSPSVDYIIGSEKNQES